MVTSVVSNAWAISLEGAAEAGSPAGAVGSTVVSLILLSFAVVPPLHSGSAQKSSHPRPETSARG